MQLTEEVAGKNDFMHLQQTEIGVYISSKNLKDRRINKDEKNTLYKNFCYIMHVFFICITWLFCRKDKDRCCRLE